MLLIPGDEVAFCLFAARSETALVERYTRQGLPVDRIVEVIELLETRDAWGNARYARTAGRAQSPSRCSSSD